MSGLRSLMRNVHWLYALAAATSIVSFGAEQQQRREVHRVRHRHRRAAAGERQVDLEDRGDRRQRQQQREANSASGLARSVAPERYRAEQDAPTAMTRRSARDEQRVSPSSSRAALRRTFVALKRRRRSEVTVRPRVTTRRRCPQTMFARAVQTMFSQSPRRCPRRCWRQCSRPRSDAARAPANRHRGARRRPRPRACATRLAARQRADAAGCGGCPR